MGSELRIRLAAPPVDGAANDALVRLLAEQLGVARSSVTIVRGHSGRSKVVEIAGADELAVRRALDLDRG